MMVVTCLQEIVAPRVCLQNNEAGIDCKKGGHKRDDNTRRPDMKCLQHIKLQATRSTRTVPLGPHYQQCPIQGPSQCCFWQPRSLVLCQTSDHSQLHTDTGRPEINVPMPVSSSSDASGTSIVKPSIRQVKVRPAMRESSAALYTPSAESKPQKQCVARSEECQSRKPPANGGGCACQQHVDSHSPLERIWHCIALHCIADEVKRNHEVMAQ